MFSGLLHLRHTQVREARWDPAKDAEGPDGSPHQDTFQASPAVLANQGHPS